MAEAEQIIDDINSALKGLLDSIECQPDTLLMPFWPTYVRLKRHWMPKRAFRRWRGKMKAQMRRERAHG